MLTEINFHQIANELLKREVEVNTIQGNFSGRLLEVGKDVFVLESRGRLRTTMLVAIRLETIVAIHRVEQMPRGPFGFSQQEFEEEQHESNNDV